MTFQKGQSGNPNGRPQGGRNTASIMLASLMENEGETIARKVIEAAKGGDMMAARLILERLVPPMKERRLTLALPPIQTAQEVTTAIASVIEAVTEGHIAPSEGQAVLSLIESQRKALETLDHENRIKILEERKI